MPLSRSPLVQRYALPPAQIEALSLERVAAFLDRPSSWAQGDEAVVSRMIYASGDPSLVPFIRIDERAVAAGIGALLSACSIVTDVRMVEVGLNRTQAGRLGCSICCLIDDPTIAAEAIQSRLPRAVLAMRAAAAELNGGIAVIGNAPTALLSLLDLIDAGATRPALIIGTPVGFVAAREAKEELVARDVPYVTIAGTRGGSALAAAAMNALFKLAIASGAPSALPYRS